MRRASSPRSWRLDKLALLAAALSLALFVATLSVGASVLSAGLGAWNLFAAAEDPVALSELRLDTELTAERVASGIDQALKEEDDELAESFVALAGEREIAVPDDRLAAITAFKADSNLRTLRNAGRGFIYGDSVSDAGLAGSFVADLTGYGDVRVLATEGGKAIRGEDIEHLDVGLAAVGLLATATSYVGVGVPLRLGLTTLRIARTIGRVSKSLLGSMATIARRAVDIDALKALAPALGRLDLTAAKAAGLKILRPDQARPLIALVQDLGSIGTKAGRRGAIQVMGLADNADDVPRASKLVSAKGLKARAVLSVLGRAALRLGSLVDRLVRLIFSAIGWFVGVAILASRAGWWIGRVIWPRKPRGEPA